MEFVKELFVCVSLLVIAIVARANIKDVPVFLKNAFKKPNVVGALLPCSSEVGKELTRYIVRSQKENPKKPLNILEVGGGTGAMTEVIIANLRDVDHLDVIEIGQDFCQMLHEKYDKYPNVSIHCLSILDWHPSYTYDFIISTLPFNSFDYELMNNSITHMTSLVTSGGILSYVAFVGIAQLKEPFLWGKKRVEHKMKMKRLKQWRSRYQIAKKIIIKNMPPINIYHLCIVNNGFNSKNQKPGTIK